MHHARSSVSARFQCVSKGMAPSHLFPPSAEHNLFGARSVPSDT